ncbi:heparin lyase I family protein [Lutibacter sp.]|uniref:heparin lyase I family protein n=1 Tax=Lutibacter sp. TaxID=1925666 RepID=UPI0034A07771
MRFLINSRIILLNITVLFLLLACQKAEEIVIPETEIEIEIEPEPEPEPETDTILSEIKLKATGEGNTYELINSVFAPGYNVVETPDCSHESFGRHIDEVFDADLNKNVFRFYIHTTPDNDRCIKFDRQRNEIKTYDKSPDELKGVKNEKVVYSWKFKIGSNFKSSSSFTHIHQIKAVGGSEDSMPLITLTTRKGSPDNLELRYAETDSQITLKKTDLSPFKGQWVEVVETVIYGEKDTGTYKIELKDFKTSTLLFDYSNDNIRMWKTNADFMRPKWGIYRSLNDSSSLQDEQVLFADFNVKELKI